MPAVPHVSGHLLRLAGLAMAAGCLLAGCATGPGTGAGRKYIFYPPPPAAPRVQHLASFGGGRNPNSVTGKFAEFVTGETAVTDPILKPYGLAMSGSQLYICDTTARAVDMLDLEQLTMRKFAPAGNARLGMPISIAVEADGSRYVSDTARNQILHFGPDDQYLGALDGNTSGTNAARFTGLALADGKLYATDINGHCVHVFDKASSRLLFTIPRNPLADESVEPGRLFIPVNVAVDSQGRIYVSDMAACRVKIFAADGTYLRSIGSQGDLPGQFARPKGLAVDRAGRVLVVDAASQTCQIFDAEGKSLLAFGEPEGAATEVAALNLPAAVCVDYDHLSLFQKDVAPGFVLEELIIISNQLGDNKISVFGLGHKD